MKYSVFLILIQTLGYLTLAQLTIGPRAISDYQQYAYYIETDSFAITFDNRQKTPLIDYAIKDKFLDTISHIIVVGNEEWYDYRIDSNYYSAAFVDTFGYNFLTNVTSYSGTLYYAEEWRTNYLWCLFFWIKLDHLCIGQS